MFGLVARLCEIQVVRQDVFLIGGSQANLHVEFAPSFLRDSEWRVFECCCLTRCVSASIRRPQQISSFCLTTTRWKRRTLNRPVPETRMQRVCHLVKDVRRHLLAMFVDEVDLNRPRSQRESFNAGVLVSRVSKSKRQYPHQTQKAEPPARFIKACKKRKRVATTRPCACCALCSDNHEVYRKAWRDGSLSRGSDSRGV